MGPRHRCVVVLVRAEEERLDYAGRAVAGGECEGSRPSTATQRHVSAADVIDEAPALVCAHVPVSEQPKLARVSEASRLKLRYRLARHANRLLRLRVPVDELQESGRRSRPLLRTEATARYQIRCSRTH